MMNWDLDCSIIHLPFPTLPGLRFRANHRYSAPVHSRIIFACSIAPYANTTHNFCWLVSLLRVSRFTAGNLSDFSSRWGRTVGIESLLTAGMGNGPDCGNCFFRYPDLREMHGTVDVSNSRQSSIATVNVDAKRTGSGTAHTLDVVVSHSPFAFQNSSSHMRSQRLQVQTGMCFVGNQRSNLGKSMKWFLNIR
jgi:hypothetical protein